MSIAIETVAAAEITTAAGKVPSIRQLILTGLRDKKSTAEIAEIVREFHPTSAAATKSVKHIAYYRCLVKQGRATLPALPTE